MDESVVELDVVARGFVARCVTDEVVVNEAIVRCGAGCYVDERCGDERCEAGRCGKAL